MKPRIKTISKLSWLSEDSAFFVGMVEDTGLHEHHAIQVTISLTNEFIIKIGGRTLSTTSIVINSDQPHRMIGNGGIQFILYFEPGSFCGSILTASLAGNQYSTSIINPEAIQDFIISPDEITPEYIGHVLIQARTRLFCGHPRHPRIDQRVEKTINHIKTVDEKKISILELSSMISLSESRLQHLFKNQTGITIKKYLLWCRLLDGIQLINTKNNFTFVAHQAGFSDSAHMCRTFKNNFGVKLTDFFKK